MTDKLQSQKGKTGLLRVHVTYLQKINKSLYKPGEAFRVPGGLSSQISRQLVHDGGKVVSRTHRPPSPPRDIPGTHFR